VDSPYFRRGLSSASSHHSFSVSTCLSLRILRAARSPGPVFALLVLIPVTALVLLLFLQMGGGGVLSVRLQVASFSWDTEHLPDFQSPSRVGRLNKSSKPDILEGKYLRDSSIRQRFDGASDDPKPLLCGSTVPRLKSYLNNPESRRIDLFQDQTSVSKYRLDGSSDSPKAVLATSTLPRLNSRSSSSEFPRRPSFKTFEPSESIKSGESLRYLDRFLPHRRPALNSTQSFRTNKDPQSLTPDEKLLRHSGASLDAFSPRRKVSSPPHQSNLAPARRNISANRTGAGGKGSKENLRDPCLIVIQEQLCLPSSEILRRPGIARSVISMLNFPGALSSRLVPMY
jgi:hypothetical protein